MPIAEVAESLFAAINSDAIIGCGSAIKEISSLYGSLGSTIDTAHQQLFAGDKTWSGGAASKAKNTMTDLSASGSNIQSALSTIGDTLVMYGTALKPFQGKVYPTPVPGSRDPEAAADLAITGTASAAAALEIGAAVLKMMPSAKQGASSSAKSGTSTKLAKSDTSAYGTTAGNGTTLAGVLDPTHFLDSLTSNPALVGAVLPGASKGVTALGPFMSAAGVIGSAEEMAALQASEAAAMREGLPLMPMFGGNAGNRSERSRTTNLTEDPEFWTGIVA
ncbi:hypothetical protein [Actinoallomurus iriomotensis]|uniref:PPE family protein n=1 Tax=Actinoallomurus iriomotensis TaxID=478107 RepID=A0A9W6S1G7_9ACTN|nr:hypothetical protein [Actinoallomurus iriomotensis]GLY83912.1 hypothetical protein Airi02_018410 [Actinoallomurus iriomotensis]